MNNEWSRCPVCFEDYSLEHRPTTFVCGHSICIDHTNDFTRLRNCPICRHPLKEGEQYHVSYNLEEASRLFQKHPVVQSSTSETIHRDEIHARRLQAQLDREHANEQRLRTISNIGNQPLVNAVITESSSAVQRDQPSGHQKRCDHRCDLNSTPRCCVCSDRRPQRQDNRYETYVDGVGIRNQVTRNEYYCSTCKRR